MARCVIGEEIVWLGPRLYRAAYVSMLGRLGARLVVIGATAAGGWALLVDNAMNSSNGGAHQSQHPQNRR
jgi:hypothetical protein